jgi:hypothetical protein
MNLSLQAKLAESGDQFLVTWPLFFGLIGLNTGASALQFFYSPQEFTWMRMLDLALEVAVVGVLALFFWRFMRFVRYAQACNSRGVVFLEGFLNRSNLQAMAFSWFVTFFVAQGLGEWTEPEVLLYGAQELVNLQPPRFYFYVLTACQCVSYALCFFLLSYLQGGGEEA